MSTAKTSKDKKELSPAQREKLLKALQARFEKNMKRHQGLEWAKVEAKLKANAEKLWSLGEMGAGQDFPGKRWRFPFRGILAPLNAGLSGCGFRRALGVGSEKEASQTRDGCAARNAALRAARPDSSLRKKRLLGMTISLTHRVCRYSDWRLASVA